MDMIKEVIERYEGEFKAIEYFTFNSGMRWHTDTLTRLTDEEEAGLTHNECVDDYALMTLEDYNETILANCAKAEDLGLDESDFPILCIAVNKYLKKTMESTVHADFYGIGFDGEDHYEIDVEDILRNEQAVWFHCGRNGADLNVDTHNVLKRSRDLIVQYLESVNLNTFYNDNLDYDDENASKVFLSIEIDEFVSVDYTLRVSK